METRSRRIGRALEKILASFGVLAIVGGLLYALLPGGGPGGAARVHRADHEPHGENEEGSRRRAASAMDSEGWQYETICPARALDRYRLRLDVSRNETSHGTDAEFRLLMERRGEDSFVCLRWAHDKLEIFRVESGRRVELPGRSSCALPAGELAPSDGNGAAAGALVVDRSPGLWAVAVGEREVLTAGDPATATTRSDVPGDVAWGATGGLSLAGRALQPVERIYFEDGFARDSFNEHGAYEVWYGDWSLESVRDAQRTANAFRLRARSNKPGRPAVAAFGYDFWRSYRLEASLRFEGEGAGGLVFAARTRRHFGLLRWKRALPLPEGSQGRLEIVEVNREAAPADGSGSAGVRDRVLLELPLSPRRNQWYRVAVSLFAERGELDIGGRREVFELPPGLRSGRAGLYANSTEGVAFDDVLVRSHDSFLALAGDELAPWGSDGAGGRLYLPSGSDVFLRASLARSYPALRLRWRDASGGSAGVTIEPLLSLGTVAISPSSGSGAGRPSRIVFPLPRPAQERDYEIELRDDECSVTSGVRTVASVALPDRRDGPVELVSGLGGGWPRLAQVALGPLAPLPALRQKTKAFSEISVSQGHEGAEFKWIGFVGWLEDRASWERSSSGDMLRCRTPLWGRVEAELHLAPPQEGRAVELLVEPEGENARAAGARVSRTQDVLVVSDAAGAELARMAPPAEGAKLRLSLRRSARALEARVGEARVMRVPFDTAGAPVRVAAKGEKVSPADLTVRTSCVDESLFEGAPTEWVRWRGHCDIAPKWQCDPRWTFMSIWSDSIDEKRDAAGIFSRASYYGDQELLFYFAFKDVLGGRNNRRYVRRDLNFAFACPGEDLARGYCVLLGGFDDRGTQLMRRGKVVAETDKFRLPPYAGRVEDIHWKWYVLRIQRRDGTIKVFVDDQEVLSWTDPEPLPGGHVAIWTVGNGIILGRTRFSAERRGRALAGMEHSPPKALAPSGRPEEPAWRPFASDRPPAVACVAPGAAKVTNLTGGGRFAAVLERAGPAKLALAFRAPAGVEVAAYAEKESQRRRLLPAPEAGGAKWLPADGQWRALPAFELAEGERLAIGCHDAEGYAAAGIGANAAGAWYEVRAFGSAEEAEAFVARATQPPRELAEF